MGQMLDHPVVRTADVQAILRIVGGAAELWYQPELQRQFTLDSLCQLFDAKVGYCDTLELGVADEAHPPAVAYGLEDDAKAAFEIAFRSAEPRDPLLEVVRAVDGRVVSFSRQDAVADADWYASDCFRRLREPYGVDHTLSVKVTASSIGRKTVLTMCRAKGAEPFSDREIHLCELCLSEMAWPFTPALTFQDPRLGSLAPRQRKVMELLLIGDGEKQVAMKLGLSRHTVHQYVKELYEALKVSSRSELLAEWVGKV
jgi:DNA-binding CsgD family transcriptional regulator